jgi:hypothetical protein
MQYAMVKFNPNAPKLWICVFIGCVIENAKNNFASIILIIGRNIIHSPGFSYAVYGCRNATNPTTTD